MLQALEVKSLGGGSVVFPLVSIGVVVVSSVIGLVLFKEKFGLLVCEFSIIL